MSSEATVQEQDLVRTYNEQAGNPWEVRNEDDESWSHMESGTSEEWVDDELFNDAVGGLMSELRQRNNESEEVPLGDWTR